MKINHIILVTCILLSGCQTQNIQKISNSSQQYITKTKRLQNSLQELYWDHALNEKTSHPAEYITANSSRISIDWDGDAIELLAQLARQRRVNFAYSGVRLPLPVSIHVSNITFEDLLRQLKTQIGWRATLKQQSLELHLYFTLPDKGGRLA